MHDLRQSFLLTSRTVTPVLSLAQSKDIWKSLRVKDNTVRQSVIMYFKVKTATWVFVLHKETLWNEWNKWTLEKGWNRSNVGAVTSTGMFVSGFNLSCNSAQLRVCKHILPSMENMLCHIKRHSDLAPGSYSLRKAAFAKSQGWFSTDHLRYGSSSASCDSAEDSQHSTSPRANTFTWKLLH